MSNIFGRSILLIITGGIAAYKSLDLIRRLRERGADVRCVMTEGAKEFITPLSVASLSGSPVFDTLFSLKDETEMGHIRLSREADLILVAPATANILSKLAQGTADDLASTILLATNRPVMAAPAMNVEMWNNKATQKNIAQLKSRGISIVGPAAGEMACGETGMGRLEDIDKIVDAVSDYFLANLPLRGKKAIVTSGPTREYIDPVRYISNESSGKQGHAIAEALALAGAETILVSGPVSIPDPKGVHVIKVTTAAEMLTACQNALPSDIAVCAAAVTDWRATATADQKIKKDGKAPSLELSENPDILATLSTAVDRPSLVIGFAAETEEVLVHAQAKLAKKNCDWIVANDVSAGVFGSDENTVMLLTREQEPEIWPRMSKKQVARQLCDRIIGHFDKNKNRTKDNVTPIGRKKA